MHLNEIQNKIYITGYTCMCRVFRKTEPSHIKEILVIESGRIGDGIMFLGALRALTKTYISSNYRITLVCRKDMQGFLHENLGDSIQLFPVEILNEWPEFREFKRVVDTFKGISFYKCIVMMSNGWGDYLAYCIFAEQKSAVHFGVKKRKFFAKYILAHGYNLSEISVGNTFLPRTAAQLMKRIGCEKYTLQKEKIKCFGNNGLIVNQKYAIIAPMANVPYRNLSQKQSVAIAKYILQNTPFFVLFTGRNDDVKYIDNILKDCNDKRCVNYAGKTDFDAFVQLIARAEFIVSADSGQIHIAAALDVLSVCLVGYQEKGLFLPYNFEQKSIYDPLCVYSNAPRCQHCKEKRRGTGSGNKECRKRRKAGLPILCLEEIDMNDVYRAIDTLIERSETGI